MSLPERQRFYSLDVLRGIAALGVVLWHWQHFFFVGGAIGPFDQGRLPLRRFLALFYDRGWMGVDLFFTLSGFIFFWLYSDAIASRRFGGGGRFALFRFSRLWPLQFATLITVAILQSIYFQQNAAFFVYSNNGPVQFIEHLVLMNAWSWKGFFSFNAPAWSISVEASLYCLFFLTCRFLPLRAPTLVVLVILGGLAHQLSPLETLRGVEPFFLGGLMFFAYRTIVAGQRSGWTKAVVILTTVAWIAGLGLVLIPGAFGPDEVQLPNGARLVLFPSLVLSLALIEHARGSLGKRARFLGNISYSVYLLHFPMQIIAMLVAIHFGLQRDLFYASWTLLGFLVILGSVGGLSNRYFEIPAQAFIRSRFTRRAFVTAG